MGARLVVASLALTLAGCTASSAAPTVTDAASGGVAPDVASVDSGFICAPPDGSTRAPVTFSGMQFDVASGCLSGPYVTLPICGCFNAAGLDSSTWCFAAPDGTTYFSSSADQCDVALPAGWYAVQTAGPSPFGAATSTQFEACERLAASSTSVTTGSYDRPGPPLCATDGGSTPAGDAAACIYPPGADTLADASGGGCRPEPGGTRCSGFVSEHFLLGCSSASRDGGAAPPVPETSLGCSAVPVEVPNAQYWCCPCGS